MKCPNCGNEIGNHPICPYCDQPVPVIAAGPTIPIIERPANEQSHFVRDMEKWLLVIVILLAGIFLLNVLVVIRLFMIGG